jgi:hypothetical protein
MNGIDSAGATVGASPMQRPDPLEPATPDRPPHPPPHPPDPGEPGVPPDPNPIAV